MKTLDVRVLLSFSQRILIAAAGGLCRDPVRAAEGGHEHDLGGQCGQEEEEEGHHVEEHLEGEEEGHPQSSWTSGKFWETYFSFVGMIQIPSSAPLPRMEVPEGTGCVGRQRQCGRRSLG